MLAASARPRGPRRNGVKSYNCEFCGAVYQDENNGYAGEQYITGNVYMKTCPVCTNKLKALVRFVEAHQEMRRAEETLYNTRQQKPQIPVWQQAAE